MSALTMSDLAGHSLGSRSASYDDRDVMLYALALGTHETELELVYERDLKVLPTFALPLGLWAVEAAAGLGVYDATHSLHVGQELTMLQTMPASGTLDMSGSIVSVWDKGAAALVEVAVASEYFVATYMIFVPGAGGFGGERGPKSSFAAPDEPPTWTTTVVTTASQAALYRLTGDRHPMHVDPVMARSAGFDRPILHGLCTLGAVVLASARAEGRSPTRVRSLSARFSAPVLPGQSIEVAGWRTGAETTFVASVKGTTVVNGTVLLA